jgi:hypothetical protein
MDFFGDLPANINKSMERRINSNLFTFFIPEGGAKAKHLHLFDLYQKGE